MVRATPEGLVVSLGSDQVSQPRERLEPVGTENVERRALDERYPWMFGRIVARGILREGTLTGNMLPVH